MSAINVAADLTGGVLTITPADGAAQSALTGLAERNSFSELEVEKSGDIVQDIKITFVSND